MTWVPEVPIKDSSGSKRARSTLLHQGSARRHRPERQGKQSCASESSEVLQRGPCAPMRSGHFDFRQLDVGYTAQFHFVSSRNQAHSVQAVARPDGAERSVVA